MSHDQTRRALIAALPGLALLLASDRASAGIASAAELPTAPNHLRPAFHKAHRAWHRTWHRYRVQDQRAAACGFDSTEPGRAALAKMDALLRRVDQIEAGLAKIPAQNRAELHLKIEILSLDGAIRPEFQDDIIADVERLLAAAALKE